VVAQAWRGGRRQAQLARFLAGCDIEPLDDGQARAVGTLAARAGATDIVDITVVEGALRRRDLVVTSDPDDLHAIAAGAGRRLEVERP
jgi:predicted nucleic acid-binding protein